MGGISGAGMTTWLEQYRPLFMLVTFGFLGLAFYLTYRPRPGSQGPSRIRTINRAMLWTVTAVATVLLFCPPSFFGLGGSDEEFTADMRRAVFIVEGMTCPG